MPPDPLPLKASYATATADAVRGFVRDRYGLEDVAACSLLVRGFNDVYALRTEAGAAYVLRLSGHRARGPADVAAETSFLAYLHAAGVPVATAVATRDGALFSRAVLPDGPRPAVLFRHAGGRKPDLDDPADAWVQGAALARVHDAADGFPEREAGRFRLDLDHLLHRQVATVLALGLAAPAACRDLVAVADRLARQVGLADGELSRTRCHGDCHGLNAHIATEGPHAGQAVLFDFDDGGFGYLAYDLAVHLWAQLSFGRRRFGMWHAFERGYRSVRPIRPADAAAIAVFVPIRHIWLIGEYAGRTAEWGDQVLSASWLEREVGFMLTWERERLSPGLL